MRTLQRAVEGWRNVVFAGALVCSLLSGAVGSAGAQGVTAGPPYETAVLLPADHWAVQAAWRAEALGLVDVFLPAQNPVPAGTVGAALQAAVRTAEERQPDLRPLAQGWLARFHEEFPGAAAAGGLPSVRLQGSAASLAYVRHTGRIAPGLAEYPPDRTGALPLDDRGGAVLAANVAASLGRHVMVQVQPRLGPDDLVLPRFEVAAAWGAWRLSAGRQPVGYGWARGGDVILSGTVPVDRVQVGTRHPVELPGWLRHLGPLAFGTFLGRLDEERHPGEPFFWGARGAIRPHPRLTLSVQRAAMFGGARADLPINARNVLNLLIGRVAGGAFENQEVSAAVRYRLPTDGLMPLTGYLEWGSEDAAGAWWDVPGRVIGLYAPALPGVPEAALGIEHASFSGRCCGNPGWYRHSAFPGSWAVEEGVLGHPLGGHGSEWRVYGRAALLDARLRVEGQGFHRERLEENLFVPGRGGESLGLEAEALWRVSPATDLFLAGAREDGNGWAETELEAGIRILLGG